VWDPPLPEQWEALEARFRSHAYTSARAAIACALESLRLQSRRVRNYSDPDDVFEAVPLRFFDERESDNG